MTVFAKDLFFAYVLDSLDMIGGFMQTWQLQEAKNKFSSLVASAQSKGPQVVTRHGEKAVVVLSYKEYEKLTEPRQDLVSFLQESPLKGVELDVSRQKDTAREIEL